MFSKRNVALLITAVLVILISGWVRLPKFDKSEHPTETEADSDLDKFEYLLLINDLRATFDVTAPEFADALRWYKGDRLHKRAKMFVLPIKPPDGHDFGSDEDVQVMRQRLDNFFLYQNFQPDLKYTFISSVVPRPNYSLAYQKGDYRCRIFIAKGVNPIGTLSCAEVDLAAELLKEELRPFLNVQQNPKFDFALRYIDDNVALGTEGFLDVPAENKWLAVKYGNYWQKVWQGSVYDCRAFKNFQVPERANQPCE